MTLLFFIGLFTSLAADITWTNGAGNNNWNDPGNWSTGTVPTTGDVAIFDATSLADCNIASNIGLEAIDIRSGYTGTLTQVAGSTITVNFDFILNGGNFLGGTANINVGNDLIIGSGFTSTMGNLEVSGDFASTVGTFVHNSGTVTFSGGTKTISGVTTFNNLTLDHSVHGDFNLNDAITVTGLFSTLGNNNIPINGATINLEGNASIMNSSAGGGGTATILVNGIGNQTITGRPAIGRGELPNIIIDKPSGSLTFDETISLTGNWTYLNGTIDYLTNDATIAFSQGNQQINGFQDFHNLNVSHISHGDFTLNNPVTVTGKFTTGGGSYLRYEGADLILEGDMEMNNSGGTFNSGSGTIRISGGQNQTIIGRNVPPSSLGSGGLPNVIIDKTGGVITFDNSIGVNGDWTYLAGSIDYITNDAVIAFTNGLQTISGIQTFHNLHFRLRNSITITDDIQVGGLFTYSGSGNGAINGAGTMNVTGDIAISNGSIYTGGTATVRIMGSNNQNISSTSLITRGQLPNVVIDKSGGTATFDGILSIGGNWNYIGGNLDYLTNDATIAITFRDQTISGVQDFHNLRFHLRSSGSITMLDEVTVTNLFTYSGTTHNSIHNEPINILGDMLVSNTTNTFTGNGTLRINGSGNQNITSTAPLSAGRLPNLEINKTSGTALFSGIFTVRGNFEYIDGTVDALTNNTTFAMHGSGTIDGEGPSGNFIFHDLSLEGTSIRDLTGDIEVQNIFNLNTNRLNLNSNAVYLLNAAPAALTNSNGRIVGDTPDNESGVYWNIQTNIGPHIIPFANGAGTRIPMTVENSTGGDLGTVFVATYPTDTANLPYPTSPDAVSHINNTAGIDDSNGAIDRFWQLDKTGPGLNVDLTFTYATEDVTVDVVGQEASLLAKRFNTGSTEWEVTTDSQVVNTALNQLRASNIDQFSPWALFLLDDPDNDGIDSSVDLDDDNDGILDSVEGILDTDGDSILDVIDLDSDNDGILDVIEAGHGQADADSDGRIDGLPVDFGANGLFNGIETDDTLVATVTYTVAESTDDADTLFNFLDLDSDGDGIPDNVEAQLTLNYIGPNADDIATFASNNGVNTAYLGGLSPTNTDTADNPDYLDTDSDNEGANDNDEAGIVLSNTDGDNDGLDDTTDEFLTGYADPGGTIDNPLNVPFSLPDIDYDANAGGDVDFRDATDDRPDYDSDGIVDVVDLDDDNDGILDTDELACSEELMDFNSPLWDYGTGNGADANGSGILNGIPFVMDFNLNGGSKIFTATSQYTSNSTLQGPGNPGSLLIGGGDASGNNGESITLTFSTPVTLVLGLDQINNVTTVNEAWLFNVPADDVVSLPDNTRIVGSGVVDGYEAANSNAIFTDIAQFQWNNISTLMVTGRGTPTTAQGFKSIRVLCDSDGDGVPNHKDLDSDGDGILDAVEAGHDQPHTNGQLNGPVGIDGIPDSVQTDPDGGTISYTVAESPDDADTILNFLDLDSDGDGVPDNVEAQLTINYIGPNADDNATYVSNNGVNTAYLGGLSPTNTDATDNPDYLDTDSDNEGGNDTIENVITLSGNDIDNDGLDDSIDTDTASYSDPGGTIDNPLLGVVILVDTDEDATTGGDVDFRDAVDDRPDTDNDGFVDAIDLDDDNDGMLDSDELSSIIGNSQWDCTGETTLDFSTAPTLESGTALTEGAVYRFPNIMAGADALVTIERTFNAFVADIDNNTAEPHAFRPRTGFDLANIGRKGYVEYRIQFVNAGGTTPVVVNKFFTNVNDIDGNAEYSEEIWAHNPSSYIISDPTELTITHDNPWIVATGGTTEYPGATNSFPQVNYGISHYSKSEIRMRAGISTIVPSAAASGREHNIEFACINNYINPQIYGLDIDLDGIGNHLDLDSDNDGIYDSVEAGHNQPQSGGRVNGSVGNDGVPDVVQADPHGGATNYTIAESTDDTDATPNFLDLDSDGDGIPDNVEAQTTIGYVAPSGSVNADGIDDAYASGLVPANTDGADQPDYLDTDSDNEGANDTTEARIIPSIADVDNDGLDDATDADTTGYADPGGTIDDPLSNPIVLPDTDNDVSTGGDVDFRDAIDNRPDNDNDGIVDVLDLDDDNDGVLDVDEGCGDLIRNGSFEQQDFSSMAEFPNSDPDNTNVWGTYIGNDLNTNTLAGWVYSQNMDGWIGGQSPSWSPDTFANAYHGGQFVDLIGNHLRSGGIANILSQVINTVPGATYTLSFYWGEPAGPPRGQVFDLELDLTESNGNVLIDQTLTATTAGPIAGLIGPKNWYYYEQNFTATADQTTIHLMSNPTGSYGGGAQLDLVSIMRQDMADCIDTDNDGVPNAFDLDSDNDGIYDAIEAGHGQAQTNGRVDGAVGTDGVPDTVQDDPNRETVNYTAIDSDGDLIDDILDLDADGDGIPDNIEAQTTIGYVAPAGTVDANGIDTAYGAGVVPENTDGTDQPDYLDLDSDNDGADDTTEAGISPSGNDSDNDGLDDGTDEDLTGYSDSGGTIDDPLSGAIILPDFDNDATLGGDVDYRDTLDLDSDDDGILDSFEDLDTDGDGNPSTNPTDSDGDTFADYLDIDSDNDGIPDNVEAQTTSGYIPPSGQDTNGNGLDDAYEANGNFGLIPENTDGADFPDYLDADSDNDNVPDAIEGNDQDHDGIADVVFIGSDKDDDGLDDAYEGFEQIDVDVNDEFDDPMNDLPNTDNDLEADYRDTDDDDDGINTIDEDANGDGIYSNDDIDSDGIPDYLELNVPDVEVFNAVTPNGDGVHDVLTISNLEERPNNTIQIFNRWGVVVYTTESYGSSGNYFDGTSLGRTTIGESEKLPTGTYFYTLHYEDTDGAMKQKAGYLYLN